MKNLWNPLIFPDCQIIIRELVPDFPPYASLLPQRPRTVDKVWASGGLRDADFMRPVIRHGVRRFPVNLNKGGNLHEKQDCFAVSGLCIADVAV